jgi:DNA primase
MEEKLIIEINEKTQIVDLVSEFVSLSKKGKNFMGLCPFHNEKTPSFSVSPEKNIAKCMSCGEGGTPINFYKKIKNISFEEAAFELANRLGIEVKQFKEAKDPYSHYYALMNEASLFYQFNLKNSQQGQEALLYLQKRQLTDETITHFKLGYAPSHGSSLYQLLKDKGYKTSDMIALGLVKQKDDGSYYDLFSDRIIFPITSPKGQVVGFSGRTKDKKEQIKYINSPETVIFKKGELLYHYYEGLSEIRKARHAILVEGFFDVIASVVAGVGQVVATMGTALTAKQAKLIKDQTDSIIIAYDGDSAGQKATEQAISILDKTGLKVEVLSIPEKMDPDEFIVSYGPEAYESLFGEYTKDSFQFRYDYYKIGKDLKNANDIKEFKTKIETMIRYADQGVKTIYLQKLAFDLGIPIDSLLKITKEEPRKEIQLPKKEKPRILNKHERAERALIFEMMKSKEVALAVTASLRSNDFADHIQSIIRQKIEKYYMDYQTFDLDDFLDSLDLELRTFVETVLLEDFYYKQKLSISPKDIELYIEIVKDTELNRRLDEINDKIKRNEKDSRIYHEERNDLLRKIKTKKN